MRGSATLRRARKPDPSTRYGICARYGECWGVEQKSALCYAMMIPIHDHHAMTSRVHCRRRHAITRTPFYEVELIRHAFTLARSAAFFFFFFA